MKHVAVESSNLASVAHDGDALLEVKFKNGAVYRYEDVPTHVHEALMAADSKGAHFHKHIRSRFKSTMVSPATKASS